MSISMTSPHLEDTESVGSRVSWSAILAGALVAMGIYFLFGTLGAAVGLSASERMNPTTLKAATVVWAFLMTIGALFVGGLVTSLFTVGENKVEAVLSGIIMWALLFTALLLIGAAGVKAGFHAMMGMSNAAQMTPSQTWEASARAAGVPAEQIDEWRRKQEGSGNKAIATAVDEKALADAASRICWYAFAGAWLSMLAAAGGALLGAGPTFRIVARPQLVTVNGSISPSPVFARH